MHLGDIILSIISIKLLIMVGKRRVYPYHPKDRLNSQIQELRMESEWLRTLNNKKLLTFVWQTTIPYQVCASAAPFISEQMQV